MPFIAVGTVFIDLNEIYPRAGRILIFEVQGNGQQAKLVLRHVEKTLGSV
jgi:hypothetical protein